MMAPWTGQFAQWLLLAASMIWSGTIAGLLWRAVQQYRCFDILRPASSPADGGASAPPATIKIIVPARNEEQNLPRCLGALAAQDYPADRLQIIVVDDQSTDDTPAIVRARAARDPRVQLIAAGPLPAGWTGKAHACWLGARAPGDCDWLCFIDADTVCEPGLLRTALCESRRRQLDLLSLAPFQELKGFWERIILPAGFFMIAFTQNLCSTHGATRPEVAGSAGSGAYTNVNGQFLLIRREAYDAVGAFAAVRSKIAEDSALARELLRRGFRVALLSGEKFIRTRMYRDLRSLWDGLARQAGELLGSARACRACAVGALALGWFGVLLPAWSIAAMGHGGAGGLPLLALILSAMGSLALLGTHIGAARYFRIPFFYGMLFPLSYTLAACLLLHSARGRRSGRVAWKGRNYSPAPQGTP